MTALATHLPRFLYDHLPSVRNASTHTIDNYTYGFTLLVNYAAERARVEPCELEVEHLEPALIVDFLNYLEEVRGNSIRTRNARLAMVKSFFNYLQYRAPTCLALAGQVKQIPEKRRDDPVIDYLDRDELQALLDAPNIKTRLGVRDRAMLHLCYVAGLRVSELVGLRVEDLGHPSLDSVRVMGKGRRERVRPLSGETVSVLKDWLRIRPQSGDENLFVGHRGRAIGRHAFARRIAHYVQAAEKKVPSLRAKHITPHCLRHTCAMHIYQETRDRRAVSLWLGHSSMQSTEVYVRADPLASLDISALGLSPKIKKGSFKGASDRLLALLRRTRRS